MSTQIGTDLTPATSRTQRPRPALAVAMLGFFVVALTPRLERRTADHPRRPGRERVYRAYRAYRAGMVLFVAASAPCGLSPDLRVLFRQEYTEVAARTLAIAYWAMGGSDAAAPARSSAERSPSSTGGGSSTSPFPPGSPR